MKPDVLASGRLLTNMTSQVTLKIDVCHEFLVELFKSWKWCWSWIIYSCFSSLENNVNLHICRTHRVPTLQWLFPPPSSSSPVTKPIIIKHQYFHDSSITINISYMVGKRTAPGFIWRWQRQRQRHTQRRIQGQRQSFQEESLPVYINLVILRSNRYI